MKKKYVSPEVIIACSYLESKLLGHSYGDADAKEQNFEADDRLFNTDTKNIWAEEDEEE